MRVFKYCKLQVNIAFLHCSSINLGATQEGFSAVKHRSGTHIRMFQVASDICTTVSKSCKIKIRERRQDISKSISKEMPECPSMVKYRSGRHMCVIQASTAQPQGAVEVQSNTG